MLVKLLITNQGQADHLLQQRIIWKTSTLEQFFFNCLTMSNPSPNTTSTHQHTHANNHSGNSSFMENLAASLSSELPMMNIPSYIPTFWDNRSLHAHQPSSSLTTGEVTLVQLSTKSVSFVSQLQERLLCYFCCGVKKVGTSWDLNFKTSNDPLSISIITSPMQSSLKSLCTSYDTGTLFSPNIHPLLLTGILKTADVRTRPVSQQLEDILQKSIYISVKREHFRIRLEQLLLWFLLPGTLQVNNQIHIITSFFLLQPFILGLLLRA